MDGRMTSEEKLRIERADAEKADMERRIKRTRRDLVHAGFKDIMTTEEAEELFEFEGFGGGIVMVTRKSDGVRGSLNFTHLPRFYFDFLAA